MTNRRSRIDAGYDKLTAQMRSGTAEKRRIYELGFYMSIT